MPGTDEAHFRRVYERYRPEIVAYFLRRVDPNDAQDLAEDVFAVAWRRRADMPTSDESILWLYGVAHRVLQHHRRTVGRRIRLMSRLGRLPASNSAGPDTQVVRKIEYEQVLLAAERLSPKDQEVLRLSLWEGLSHQEIARATGTTAGATKQRIHRARQRLAREYTHIENTQAIHAATRKGGDV